MGEDEVRGRRLGGRGARPERGGPASSEVPTPQWVQPAPPLPPPEAPRGAVSLEVRRRRVIGASIGSLGVLLVAALALAWAWLPEPSPDRVVEAVEAVSRWSTAPATRSLGADIALRKQRKERKLPGPATILVEVPFSGSWVLYCPPDDQVPLATGRVSRDQTRIVVPMVKPGVSCVLSLPSAASTNVDGVRAFGTRRCSWSDRANKSGTLVCVDA